MLFHSFLELVSIESLSGKLSGKLEAINDMSDRQLFVVITSEHQIKVIALPSMITVHKYSISEGTVAKASVVVLNSNKCVLITF